MITNIIPYDWPVIIYLTLSGIACGSAVLAVIFMSPAYQASKPLVKLSLWLAFLSIPLGTAGLLTHLEVPEFFFTINRV